MNAVRQTDESGRVGTATFRSMLFVALTALVMSACASGPTVTSPDGQSHTVEGVASWYGEQFHGNQTASGETYNMYQHTAAHRTLPFGTRVRVTRRDNGRAVVVRINDRGPFADDRIIDLSYAAAAEVGMINDGLAPVELEVVQW